MLCEKTNVLKGGAAPGKSCGSLNVVCSGPGNNFAHLNLLLLREKAGLNNYFQDFPAADRPQRADLLFNQMILLLLEPADVDHHIELVRPVCNGVLRLKFLDLSGHIAVWKADHSADRHFSRQIFACLLYKRRRNAHAGSPVLNRVVANPANLLPDGCLKQQSMIYMA